MEENNNNENQVKEAAKKASKKIVKKLMIKIMKYVIIGVACLFAILLAVGVLLGVQWLIKSAFNSLLSMFSGKKPDSSLNSTSKNESVIYIDENGYYKMKVEDLAEQILQELEDKKVDTEEFGLSSKEFENMLNKYVKAEVQTTLPKTGKNGLGQNDVDGTIIVKRATTDGEKGKVINLKYKNYKDFCDTVESNPSEALKCFSINPDNFKICIAKRNSTTTYYDFNGKVIPDKGESSGITIEERDYQKYIQNYSAPLNFFVTLHLISQDNDFMQDLVDLVLGTEKEEPIVLTYVDSFYETTTTYDYSGKLTTQIKPITSSESNTGIAQSTLDSMTQEEFEKYVAQAKKGQVINNTNIAKYYDITFQKRVTTSYSGKWYVTNADTWLATSGKTLNDCESITTSDESETTVKNEDILPAKVINVVNTEDGGKINKYNEKDHVIIREKVTTESTSKKYTLVDKESQINVDDFIELIKKYPKVENNITTAPSNVFYLLQQSENTQHLEKIMRYVIYKLTDIDYGVSLEDLEYLLKNTFDEYEGNIRSLADYLLIFSHGGRHAPQSEDGKYYKMYGDGKGWPTIGDADLQWKSHQGSFSVPGKIMHLGKEMEVANVADYVNEHCLTKGADSNDYSKAEVDEMEIYIEKELVDSIGGKVQQAAYDYVLAETSGLNLRRQQIYPLVAIKYNFGHLPIRNGKTFKETYLEASEKYEEYSWEHNRYVWDNWWCALGGGAAGHINSRDAQFETYVKGIFDYSLSEYGPLGSRSCYIYYTQEQLNSFDYAIKKTLIRTPENEEEIFTTEYNGRLEIVEIADEIHKYMEENEYTYCVKVDDRGDECRERGKSHGLNTTFEESKTGHQNTCCATYVSWVLQEAGYLDASEHTNGASSLVSKLQSKGWTEITNYDDLEPGDVLYYWVEKASDGFSGIGHVDIYAGDGTKYNAGGGKIIREASPSKMEPSGFYRALRAPDQ